MKSSSGQDQEILEGSAEKSIWSNYCSWWIIFFDPGPFGAIESVWLESTKNNRIERLVYTTKYL